MSLQDLGKQLLESAKLGETEEVRLLMTNGAPFTTDWLGFSPLHLAAQNGNKDTCEVLLRAGISRDARTKVDRTPLHVAAQEGHFDVVELLTNHGCEIDALDMLKMTPLHWAVERGNYSVVVFLLEKGANVTALNKFDKTPLDIAEDSDNGDLIDLLQQFPTNSFVKKEPMFNRMHLRSSQPPPIVVTSSPKSPNLSHSISSTKAVKSPLKKTPIILRSNYPKFTAASSNRNVESGSDSENGETGECTSENSSTNVLATLAALAEATAPPNASISTADAVHWLESHGIQMLPTDHSTVVETALEGGQTVALTEAGKLALTFVKEHQSFKNSEVTSSTSGSSQQKVSVSSVSSSTNPKVITIVADQNQLPSIISSQQTPIVLLSSQPISSNVVDSTPSVKKIKLCKKTDSKVVVNGNSISTILTAVSPTSEKATRLRRLAPKEADDEATFKLKQELEAIRKEAETYKAQLQQKAHEAEQYKRQLEEIQTLPRVNQ